VALRPQRPRFLTSQVGYVMSKRGDKKEYCSDCGNWATDCETVIVYGAPEKVCGKCRRK